MAKKKSKEEETSEAEPVARKVITLRISKKELAHIRDLFSILLPMSMKRTVSQQLARIEGRDALEAKLWQKIVTQCKAADVPVGSAAPDHYVATASLPDIGVFHVDDDHLVVDATQDSNEAQNE